MPVTERTFVSSWEIFIYQSYEELNTTGHVVLLDYRSGWTSLSKSGTHSACSIRIRILNVRKVCHKWYTVGIAPTSSTFTHSLPNEDKNQSLPWPISTIRVQAISRFNQGVLKRYYRRFWAVVSCGHYICSWSTQGKITQVSKRTQFVNWCFSLRSAQQSAVDIHHTNNVQAKP